MENLQTIDFFNPSFINILNFNVRNFDFWGCMLVSITILTFCFSLLSGLFFSFLVLFLIFNFFNFSLHCSYNFMHVAAKNDNVRVIRYLLELMASDAYWLRLFPSLASSSSGAGLSAAQTRLLLSPSSPMQRSSHVALTSRTFDAAPTALAAESVVLGSGASTTTAASTAAGAASNASRFPCACDRSRDPITGHVRWIARAIAERRRADATAAPRIDCVFHERARYLLDLYINISDKTVNLNSFS